MEEQEKIYQLKLHETTIIHCDERNKVKVIRVPGGWIYKYYRLEERSRYPVFVPFNNEFE